MTAQSVSLVLHGVAALAWPLVAGVVAWLFRLEIRSLLGRIRTAKLPWVELEMEAAQAMVEVQELAERDAVPQEVRDELDRIQGRLEGLAEGLAVMWRVDAEPMKPRTYTTTTTRTLTQDATVAEILRSHREGKAVADISAETGLRPSFVTRILHENRYRKA